jgi:hypothetical protein
MTEPIVDLVGRHWTIWSDEDSVHLRGCIDPDCDGDSGDCATHEHFTLDRADAVRLAIELATALAGRPVPPIGEADGQLELPFTDPPWQR